MTTISESTTLNPTTSPADLAKGAVLGLGVAVIANVLIFLIGNAGAPLQVVATGETVPSDLPLVAVIAASILPILVGTIGLGVLQRFADKSFQIFVGVVTVLTLVSLGGPATLEVDTGSKIALAIMHLVVGAAAILGHAASRRSRA